MLREKRIEMENMSIECFGVKSRYKTLARKLNLTIEQMEQEMHKILTIKENMRVQEELNEHRSNSPEEANDSGRVQETLGENQESSGIE